MDGPIAQIRRPTAQWRKAAPVQRKYAHSSALAPMVMPLYYREADNTTTAAHCKRTPHMLDSGFSSLLRCCAAPHAYSALTTLLVRLYLFSLSLHPSSLVSWPQAAKVRRLTPPAPPWEMGAAPARAANCNRASGPGSRAPRPTKPHHATRTAGGFRGSARTRRPPP